MGGDAPCYGRRKAGPTKGPLSAPSSTAIKAEDSGAEVDMNFVMTSSDRFVEVQGTAETEPFTLAQMDALRHSAMTGIRRLFAIQQEILKG